jgi:hypothetical protein
MRSPMAAPPGQPPSPGAIPGAGAMPGMPPGAGPIPGAGGAGPMPTPTGPPPLDPAMLQRLAQIFQLGAGPGPARAAGPLNPNMLRPGGAGGLPGPMAPRRR